MLRRPRLVYAVKEARSEGWIGGLLHVPDFLFDFLRPFGIELLLIRGQFTQKAEKLARVNAFFVRDVLVPQSLPTGAMS